MKIGTISKLVKDVEYTTDRQAFELRMKIQCVDEKNIPLLWKIYKLIIMTDYAPKRVRETFNKGVTYKDIAEKDGVNIGTVKRQVHNFSRKMVEVWGDEDIINILREGKDIEESYLENIELLVDDCLKNSELLLENLEDKFSVNILKNVDMGLNFSGIGRDDFIMLRNKLVSFSIPSQEFILKNLDNKLLSYGVYLLTTPYDNMNPEDRSRKKELVGFTKIKIDN